MTAVKSQTAHGLPRQAVLAQRAQQVATDLADLVDAVAQLPPDIALLTPRSRLEDALRAVTSAARELQPQHVVQL